MPTTSLGLRYPALSAAPNVPADTANLAADANTELLKLQPLFARKTGTEPITSNTTLQNDDHLFVSVAASTVYEMSMMLKYDGAAAGDLKIGWSAPAGATLDFTAAALGAAAALYTDDQTFVGDLASTPTFGALGASTNCGLLAHGLLAVGGTAGTFRLTWAQGTSSGTATRLFAGSYLCLRRVA